MSLSAQDIVILWEAAKKLGATSIVVNGVEVKFLQRGPEANASGSLSEPPQEGKCPDCGTDMRMNRWGKLYCFHCWQDSKHSSTRR